MIAQDADMSSLLARLLEIKVLLADLEPTSQCICFMPTHCDRSMGLLCFSHAVSFLHLIKGDTREIKGQIPEINQDRRLKAHLE